MTITALTGLLVLGAAAASILGRDGVPAAGPALAAAYAVAPSFVSNREAKGDRLAIAAVNRTPTGPANTGAIPRAFSSEGETGSRQENASNQESTASLQFDRSGKGSPEPLRQAFAASPSSGIEGLRITDPALPLPAPPKPKLASKPPAQKSYALLSDAQIAGIKERLKLSSSQESYWPAVESALRAVARKIHATRQADPSATGTPIIDPDAEEVQQLKSAAMPLLFQLREDQKREVRQLARLIGLEKVAAQI